MPAGGNVVQMKTVNDVLGGIWRARIEGDCALLYLVGEMEKLQQSYNAALAEIEELKKKLEPENEKKDA